jgi:hypothetical protein
MYYRNNLPDRSSLSSWVLLLLIFIGVVSYIAYRHSQTGAPAEPIELETPDSPAAVKNDPYYGISRPQ